MFEPYVVPSANKMFASCASENRFNKLSYSDVQTEPYSLPLSVGVLKMNENFPMNSVFFPMCTGDKTLFAVLIVLVIIN